jgi:hypothetical protein
MLQWCQWLADSGMLQPPVVVGGVAVGHHAGL